MRSPFIVVLSLAFASIMLPISCDAVELHISPSNATIHVGEPVNFDLQVVNPGEEAVSGVFVPISAGFAGLTLEISGPPKFAKYTFVRDETADDMFYPPTILEPGSARKGTFLVLYDMRKNCYVFNEPGEYELEFDLRWDWSVESSLHAVASVTVKVLAWDKEKASSSLEALSLWTDRNIAYAYQCGERVPEGESLNRLKRLKTEYGNTSYGQLAATLLGR